MTSGDPKSLIVSPILFLLHANSLPMVVTSSRLATFAGDTKIFKTIVTQEDSSLKQVDLRNLASLFSCVGRSSKESKKSNGYLESSFLSLPPMN